MDDLIHSTSTQEEAGKSKGEVDNMLATGSFKIKEWFVSSSVEEMQAENVSSPEEENPDSKDNVIGVNSECTMTKNVNLDGEEGIKTLGVNWNPQTDKFSFSVKEIKIETLKCYCDENSSSRKFPFLLATTLLLHQKCLCKISGEHD
jgi:hypothetical protein